MLETIREYGQECLAASREMDTTHEAHAAYYLALAEEATRGFKGRQQAEWLERIEGEHDNLRTAMEWSLDPAQAEPGIKMALRLCEAMEVFWDVRGLYSEGRAFLDQALTSGEEVAASDRARALNAAAGYANVQGDFDQGEESRSVPPTRRHAWRRFYSPGTGVGCTDEREQYRNSTFVVGREPRALPGVWRQGGHRVVA